MDGAGELDGRAVIGQSLRVPSRLRGCGSRCCMRFIHAGKKRFDRLYAAMCLMGQGWMESSFGLRDHFASWDRKS